MYGLDRHEPTDVHDAQDYSTIMATRTMTGRPQQLVHNSVCMNARPIRPHTVTDIKGNRSKIFGTSCSP
jgi:hypothetical protein